MPAPHHSISLQAGCPSCRPTNSVKAPKAIGKIIRTALYCVEWLTFDVTVHLPGFDLPQ